jgi:hypothetical protein
MRSLKLALKGKSLLKIKNRPCLLSAGGERLLRLCMVRDLPVAEPPVPFSAVHEGFDLVPEVLRFELFPQDFGIRVAEKRLHHDGRYVTTVTGKTVGETWLERRS